MIRPILKFIKALHSDVAPVQISLAACLGMVMGLTPFWAFHSWVIVLLMLVVRLNVAVFLVTWGLVKGVGLALDGPLNSLGEALLTAPALEGLWSAMYRSSFWQATHFNNTAVLGSFLVALIAFVPMLLLLRVAVVKYRDRLAEYVRRSRLLKVMKANKFYRAYAAIR